MGSENVETGCWGEASGVWVEPVVYLSPDASPLPINFESVSHRIVIQ